MYKAVLGYTMFSTRSEITADWDRRNSLDASDHDVKTITGKCLDVTLISFR